MMELSMSLAINSNIPGAGGLHYLSSAQKEQAADTAQVNQPAQSAQASPDYVISGGGNLMSRNFASSGGEQSKYVAATLQSFQNKAEFSNKMDGVMGSMMATMEQLMAERKDGSASIAGLIAAARAKRQLNTIQGEEVVEKAEAHLRASRENIEAQAQEALTQVDENGNPLPEVAQTTAPAQPPAPSASPESAMAAQAAMQAQAAAYVQQVALAAPSAPDVSASVDVSI